MINTKGIEKKNRQNISYSCIPSAIRPVLHSGEFPPPVYNDFASFKDEIEFEDVRMEYEYKKKKQTQNLQTFLLKAKKQLLSSLTS